MFQETVRQLFWGPISAFLSLFTVPYMTIKEVYQGSDRGRAFVLATPAVFFAFIAILLLVAGQIGRNNRLKVVYDARAKKAADDVRSIIPDYNNSVRLLRNEMRSMYLREANDKGEEIDEARMMQEIQGRLETNNIPEELLDTEVYQSYLALYEKIRAIRASEKLYLQKLKELDPNNLELQFRYALSYSPIDSRTSGELIRQMAPIDDNINNKFGVGYPQAHLLMVQNLFNSTIRTATEKNVILDKIVRHCSRVLLAKPGDNSALRYRGRAYYMMNKFTEAYEDFLLLFEADARFFQDLLIINGKLGRTDRDSNILDRASARLFEAIAQNRDNPVEWESNWEHYAECMMKRKRFAQLRSDLVNERDRFSGDIEAKKAFLNQLLANRFSDRINDIITNESRSSTESQEAIEMLEQASSTGFLNAGLKTVCTKIALTLPEFSDRAKAIYDYELDESPPAEVQAEVGSWLLSRQEYGPAIELLEAARQQRPSDPRTLNNLAYGYLSAENGNPTLALELVNEAIRLVSSSNVSIENLSVYYHTRGTAFLQLGRMVDAHTAFRAAYAGRPENEGILQGLIMSSEGRDELMAETYRKRLKELQDKKAASDSSK